MGDKKNPIKKCPIIEEKWKQYNYKNIKQNYYSISNLGRAKNQEGLILKPCEINSGYLSYRLVNQTYTGTHHKYTPRTVHRMVLETFEPIPDMDKKVVNHKDHDKHNNCLYNLEWVTERENNIDSIEYHHTYGEHHCNSKFNTTQLKIIADELNKGTSYADILSLIGVEITDNNKESIGNIKRGITYQRELKNIM